MPPFEKRNGGAMSSSPWELASEDNEDVAAPGIEVPRSGSEAGQVRLVRTLAPPCGAQKRVQKLLPSGDVRRKERID